MKPITNQLTNWAISKIKEEYPEDVALLIALEGHDVDGDGHGKCFDYFVPATDRGNGLSRTFIIDGIGYDLYPRSWERMERTATLEDASTFCLGSAKILYSRSEADTARFESIRQQLFTNLADKTFVYQKALEKLDTAMDLYRTLMFEGRAYQVRMAVGYIAHYLIDAVTFLNGTYVKDLSEGKLPHLRGLAKLPDSFLAYYEAILRAQSESDLKNLAHLLISTTRGFIESYKPAKDAAQGSPDFQNLADWYQEISLWWRRLYYYCRTGNADAAFIEACQIQSELNIIGTEFNLKEMDLLGAYDAARLHTLHERAAEWEAYIIAEIEAHGASVARYNSFEDFMALGQ